MLAARAGKLASTPTFRTSPSRAAIARPRFAHPALAARSDEPAECFAGDKDWPAGLGGSVEENVVADVIGYDEEEPGMAEPIKASVPIIDLKGGLPCPPSPATAAGRTRRDEAQAGGGAEVARAAGAAAAAPGGYGHGGTGEMDAPGTMAERAMHGGPCMDASMQAVTGSNEARGPQDVPSAMRNLADDVRRQEHARD